MDMPVFHTTFTVTAADVDCFGRAKPSSLLYFVQETAGAHCTALSVDRDNLKTRHLFWAIIRCRVEIARLPLLGETVRVETWPMPTTRSSYPRSTVGYDKSGQALFRCVGLWVLMDTENRTMVLPGKSKISLTGTLRGNELVPPGAITPRILENTCQRQVGFTELDGNGHMNNTKYLDWLMDLLPAEFHRAHPLRAFTVCYLSEALEGEKIDLNWQLFDGPYLHVEGRRRKDIKEEKPERVFASQLQF